MSGAAAATSETTQDELECLARGVGGGMIFAVPILYTMEMWWLAYETPSWKVLVFLLFSRFRRSLLGA